MLAFFTWEPAVPKSSNRPLYLALGVLFAIASLPILAFSAWFFYDGTIAYPAKQRQQLAYEQLQQQHPPGELHQRWLQTAQANGWPTQTPQPPMSDMSIVTQYILGTFCALIGLCGLLIPAAILLGKGLQMQAGEASTT